MQGNNEKEFSSLKTELLYLNSYQGTIVITLTSLIIYAFSYHGLSKQSFNIAWLHIWFVSILLCCFIRIFVAMIFKKSTHKIAKDHFWRKLFYLFTALSGSGLGVSLLFVSRIESTNYMVFIALLIGALSTGSISTLSTSITAFAIYNSLVLIPYSIFFITQENEMHKACGIIIVFFFLIVLFTAYKIKRTLDKSFSLKIENDQIIKKLSQSEEKFSKSFYSGVAPMALIRIDNGKFIDVNNAMLKLLHYSRDEIIGKNPYDLDLYSSPDDVISIIYDTSKKGFIKNREITLKTKNSSIIHCLVTIENFRLNSSTIGLVMLQDYTQRIEYERNLKLEKEKAENAAAAKSKFLATMSHEIRTPMNSIIGMTNLALISEDTNERTEYLDVVKDSANYLLNLIDDILNMSKLEAGKVEIINIDIDLQEELNKIFKIMELLALSKKLEYTLSISKDLPRYIKTAPERLRQILLNLIGNAIKFTPAGKIEISVSGNNGLKYFNNEKNMAYIEFSVKDTGIGISQDKLEKIFESFSQADNKIFRKFGGTGLGLSISKQLVKMMNGHIMVESEPGKGSNFSFILPLEEGIDPAYEKSFTVLSRGKSPVVLIAEDNIMNQKLVKAYMKKLKIDYSIAENGLKAIEQLKTGKYNIVLMDLEMPVLDGSEAMKKIRAGEAGENYSHIPIYAMSAYSINEIKDKCLREGFTGYLTKPVDIKTIKNILEKETIEADNQQTE